MKVNDPLQQKLRAKWECGNGVDQYQECMLDTMSDLVEKVYRKVRKPWITQEMINQMNE